MIPNNEYKVLMKEKEAYKEKAKKAYEFGISKAEKNIIASSPIRLGLSLNYSVFLNEVIQDYTLARDTAEKAVEVALKKLDTIEDEEERQDADTIIDMLHDNLKNWEAEEEEKALENEAIEGEEFALN